MDRAIDAQAAKDAQEAAAAEKPISSPEPGV
jgi:hypothetical protein